MTKYFIGAIGSLGGMLIGAWLVLAPFALAYQPSGAGWADPTYVDFWSGLAILVFSLVGLIMYVLGLVGELRRLGVIEKRREEEPQPQQAQAQVSGTPVAPTGAETPTSSGDIEQILLPLVTAMLQDMQDQRRREEDGGNSQQSPHQNAAAPTSDQERRTQQ